MEWTREVRMESDEEKEKKPKKARKPRSEVPSGDEGEPRKKRRGKLRKAGSEQGDEEGAIFTDEDEAERPAKKVSTWLDLQFFYQISDFAVSGQQRNVLSEMMTTRRPPILAKSNCTCIYSSFSHDKIDC